MKKYYFLSIILVFLSFVFSERSFGEWQGPKEITSGKWGNTKLEFGFEHGDTQDAFPGYLIISDTGKILISDFVNKELKLYNAQGKFVRVIVPPVKKPELWNLTPLFMGSNIILSLDKIYYMSDSGEIIRKLNYPLINANNIRIIRDKIFIEQFEPYKSVSLSITDTIEKTYDIRPLELGITQQRSLGGGNYETTIEYPDKKWKVNGLCMKYTRDACGILYCVDNAIVIRYDDEGKDVAFVGMPDEKIEQLPNPNPPGSGVDAPINVIEQYGSPVLAPNGDVYTWKRTPDKYSIIKWVWVDGPECPQYLDVTPTKNSLKFTWQKPLKDADKITYYQLLQSYNICGPFRQVNLLKKNQLSYEDRDVKKGETYYYIVKAVRGKEFSGNSNKVCGQME